MSLARRFVERRDATRRAASHCHGSRRVESSCARSSVVVVVVAVVTPQPRRPTLLAPRVRCIGRCSRRTHAVLFTYLVYLAVSLLVSLSLSLRPVGVENTRHLGVRGSRRWTPGVNREQRPRLAIGLVEGARRLCHHRRRKAD